MPTWLINILVQVAIKVGLPYLVKWIPGIPAEVLKIISDLLESLKKPEVSNSAARKAAIAKVKACTIGCSPETKND